MDENPNYRTLVPLCTTDTPEVFVKTLPEISLMNTLDVQAQADWSDDINLIEETCGNSLREKEKRIVLGLPSVGILSGLSGSVL